MQYRIFIQTGITSLFLLVGTAIVAQDSLGPVPKYNVPQNRQLFHDNVNKEQLNLLKGDGKADNEFHVAADEEINFMATQALVNKIDWIQYTIEKDTAFNHPRKVRYIRGMEMLLKGFYTQWRSNRIRGSALPALVGAYEKAVQLEKAGESVEGLISSMSYEAGTILYKSGAVDLNSGFAKAKDILTYKYCALHPDQIFKTLRENPDLPLADSLIKVAAYKYPVQLYDYASAINKLSAKIRAMDDPLIKTVSRMATMKGGTNYFPMLDNLMKGKVSFGEIDSAKTDSLKYYKLLVKTHLDYVQQMINKDTPIAAGAIYTRLARSAREIFVDEINGLHDLDDLRVRFRIIQPMTPEELYYLAVTTDGTIYTSSYVKGVYPLMMSKVNNRGDSLLQVVKFDKYRKFLRQAAAYNTLGSFLNSFPDPEDAKVLMKAFVSNLEKSEGTEDGVDVADSYASIMETNKPLSAEILNLVKQNYERNLAQDNKKGIAMYNILRLLFLSADTLNKIDLTKELGIPPVYSVGNKLLANDSGRVIMQVFFYGDKDGQGIFKGFLGMFPAAAWKVDYSNPQWVVINSTKGTKVSIYANRALPEETGEDDKAQKALMDYLQKNKLFPTVTIHRGHSYFANTTIDYMFPNQKVVFMGSCGGYHLINGIKKKSVDAHIIASKQIGKTAVNRPFFQLFTEKIRNGKDIEWIPFWHEFDKLVNVEGFEDYIPPHKNLGAIFIQAYNMAMQTGEGEE